jgi:hypothetical protein
MRKSKRKWKCSEGCKLIDKPCPHLEKLLPQMRERHPLRVTDLKSADYNRMSQQDSLEFDVYTQDVYDLSQAEGSEHTLRHSLRDHTLDVHDKDYLVDLIVHRLGQRKLMAKYGFNKSVASYMIYKRRLFAILKNEGYSPKGEENE